LYDIDYKKFYDDFNKQAQEYTINKTNKDINNKSNKNRKHNETNPKNQYNQYFTRDNLVKITFRIIDKNTYFTKEYLIKQAILDLLVLILSNSNII